MTTITMANSHTRFLGLPRNRTGLFAADTIHEVKPTRNHLITVPPLSPQFRHHSSMNLLLASAEQTHHQLQQYILSNNEIQQYYPVDQNPGSLIDSSNDSRLTNNGIRNGFRPSTVRHQKLRLTTASTYGNNNHYYYEKKDSPPKSAFIQSHASAKLKSEINHMNNKLIRNKETNRNFLNQSSRELIHTPHSPLSFSTSNRGSSPSTQRTADRIHRRFSSAITHITANTRATLPTINTTSTGITVSSPSLIIHENDDNEEEQRDYQPTHAYQVPQQSNVGSDSIFLTDPPPISSIKTRSAKLHRRSNDLKSVSCPFYVVYFTNLAMQQRENKDNNNTNEKENNVLTINKVPVNSRTSASHPKRQSIRKQGNSPISMKTYSTIDDDDRLTNSTSISFNKRLLQKLPTVEDENLGDILRTSSCNPVQV